MAKRTRACSECGFDDDWHENGRGDLFCGCQVCPECHEMDPGWHAAGCSELEQGGE